VCRDGRLEVTAVLAALAYPELASAAPRQGDISPYFIRVKFIFEMQRVFLTNSFYTGEYIGILTAVLRIHDILVWIRIRGSIPLTNGSGSGSWYFFKIST
jgi:hypothetical protein